MTRSRVAPRSLVLLSLAARSTAPDRSRPDRSRPDSLLPVKSAGLSDVAAASTVSTCARVISASTMSDEVRSTWRIISCAAAAPLKPLSANAAANARAGLITFLRSGLQDQELRSPCSWLRMGLIEEAPKSPPAVPRQQRAVTVGCTHAPMPVSEGKNDLANELMQPRRFLPKDLAGLTCPRDFGPLITRETGSRFGGSNAQSAFHGRADGGDHPRGGSRPGRGGRQAARYQRAAPPHGWRGRADTPIFDFKSSF